MERNMEANMRHDERPLQFEFRVLAMTTSAASREFFLLTNDGWKRHKERGT